MWVQHLVRAVWPMIIGAMVVLVLSLIFSNILIPHHGVLRYHPWGRRLVQATPLLYPFFCWAAFSLAVRHDRRVEQMLKVSGVPAVATVKDVRDLGIDVNADPMVLLELEVVPAGASPFEAEMSVTPSRLVMQTVQPGMTLRVRYDPKDHSRLIVQE